MMLLKQPSQTARPFHITIKISDLSEMLDGLSTGYFHLGLVSEFLISVPKSDYRNYQIDISGGRRESFALIGHTEAYTTTQRYGN